jgi:hypothetical protein
VRGLLPGVDQLAAAAAGRPLLALVFAAVLAVNEILGFAWGQREIA